MLISTAAFADEDLIELSYGDVGTRNHAGFLTGGDGTLLVAAIVGIVTIFAWVTVWMVPFFLATKYLNLLRVSPEEEDVGLDVSHHGGGAYPTDMVKMEGDG